MISGPKTSKLSDIKAASTRDIQVAPTRELHITDVNLGAVLGEPGKGMGFDPDTFRQ